MAGALAIGLAAAALLPRRDSRHFRRRHCLAIATIGLERYLGLFRASIFDIYRAPRFHATSPAPPTRARPTPQKCRRRPPPPRDEGWPSTMMRHQRAAGAPPTRRWRDDLSAWRADAEQRHRTTPGRARRRICRRIEGCRFHDGTRVEGCRSTNARRPEKERFPRES